MQVVAWLRDRTLVEFLPPALGATAAAFLTGLWMLLATEFGWVSGETLDGLSLFVLAGALWWIFHNRIGSARNRRRSNPARKPD